MIAYDHQKYLKFNKRVPIAEKQISKGQPALKWNNKYPNKFRSRVRVHGVTLLTSLFLFHLTVASRNFIVPHLIDYVSFYFLQFTVHLIHSIYHSPYHSHFPNLVALILHGYWSLLSVSLFSQSRLWKLTTYECL